MVKTSIAVLLIGTVTMASIGTSYASIEPPRVLSEEEAEQIYGEGSKFKGFLKVLEVVADVCTVLASGWLALEETWTKGESDQDSDCDIHQNHQGTVIRVQTQNSGGSCSQTSVTDTVHESVIYNP